ncbi:MAG: RNA 2',3'-cyclic phosphodiesterase [Planctomycetes bacterium]|nr:RNA 2',3'-cyclic phosphodiesterase [Planctomycetota bacterium]
MSPSGTIRAFAAVPLSEDARSRLGALVEELAPAASDSVRWVKPEAMHMTLRFLGDTRPEAAADFFRALAASPALAGGPIELHLAGVTAFPDSDRPRVIVALAREPTGRLAGIAAAAEELARAAGYPREERGFRAHITLGRAKDDRRRGARRPPRDRSSPSGRGDLARALAERASLDLGLSFVSEVVLFRSDLAPGGATYTALDRIPLAG